jgi:universal stress protein A
VFQYKHVLLATDLTEHWEHVAECAHDLACKYNASLSIVHIIDNLPVTESLYGPIIPLEIDLTTPSLASAQNKIFAIAKTLKIDKQHIWIRSGTPRLEIIRIAKENDIDLIVVGSHGRHGFSLLLGSTANSVLHYTVCDVLAVRIHHN